MPISLAQPPAGRLFERVTATHGFAAMVRPHLLRVPGLAARMRIVSACQIAWNLATVSSETERERDIDTAAHIRCIENPNAVLGSEVAMLSVLVSQHHRSFPHMRTRVHQASLQDCGTHDRLEVQTTEDREIFRLTAYPTLAELPDMEERLASVLEQATTLQLRDGKRTHGDIALPDIWATRVCNQARLLLLEASAHRAALLVMQADAHSHEQFSVSRVFELVIQVQNWALSLLGSFGLEG